MWSEPVAGEALEIVAQATDSDGNPGANSLRQLTNGHVPGGRSWRGHNNVIPTGSGFAVTWFERSPDGLNPPYLMLVDGDGNPTTGAILVPEAPQVGYFPLNGPPVAFSGEILAVAWSAADSRLYLSRFDDTGARIGSDLLISSAAVDWTESIGLIWTGEVFLAAWTAFPDGNGDICLVRSRRICCCHGTLFRLGHPPAHSLSRRFISSCRYQHIIRANDTKAAEVVRCSRGGCRVKGPQSPGCRRWEPGAGSCLVSGSARVKARRDSK